MNHTDTIVASATAPGRGAISVLRLSGPESLQIAQTLSGKTLTPRVATYGPCLHDGLIDTGLWLYFPGPHSFTGEDVCEFQGHGGPVVIQAVVQAMITLGARHAKPGEFSERAFLNDKIDLAQAEAISDLISASSIAAVKAANRSLSGQFSDDIHELVTQLIALRVHLEAHIDFPDEDISPNELALLGSQLTLLDDAMVELLSKTEQGARLNHAFDVVLVGPPNAGKSSLLNAIAREPLAIVTDIPGTTRDLIRHSIIAHGLELRITDTAGIRDTEDEIEHEGITRARQAINTADLIVCLLEASNGELTTASITSLLGTLDAKTPILLVQNKIDIHAPAINHTDYPCVHMSAKTGEGLSELLTAITGSLQLQTRDDLYLTRQRHVDLVRQAYRHVIDAKTHPLNSNQLELIAEDLRLAQNCLSDITGTFTSDDLLGEIFSTFCIGK